MFTFTFTSIGSISGTDPIFTSIGFISGTDPIFTSIGFISGMFTFTFTSIGSISGTLKPTLTGSMFDILIPRSRILSNELFMALIALSTWVSCVANDALSITPA